MRNRMPLTPQEKQALADDVRQSIERLRQVRDDIDSMLAIWDRVIPELMRPKLPESKPEFRERNQR